MNKLIHLKKNKLQLLIFASIFAIIGTITLVLIRAATSNYYIEPETSTLSGNASAVTDSNASGGSAVRFSQASGGFQANCISVPSSCGYPDATNTGVPAGTTLTNSGSITVTQNGAIIENKNIVNNGQIIVRANNVTIKNVKISGCTYYPIDYDGGFTGLVVQDSEIHSTCSITTACMSFVNYTAIRINCHGAADGFKGDNNVIIRDSYIHDLWVTADSHNDGLQSTGGSNITLTHNTYDVREGGVCVQLGAGETNHNYTNNLFNCTGWMINGGAFLNNSSFISNRFTRFPGYGTHSIEGMGNTWTGNYYDDNGATVIY
jgi:hypothetical protein